MIVIGKGSKVGQVITGNVTISNMVITVGDSDVRVSGEFVQGSGVPATDNRALVGPIQKLKVASVAHVEVVQAPQLSCTVSADDNIVEMVTTEVEDGKLVIGFNGSACPKLPIEIKITAPDITKFKFSGSGTLDFTGINQPKFRGSISGAGKVSLSGQAEKLQISFSGAGVADTTELKAMELCLDASGAGHIKAFASRSADLSVSGVAKVRITGNPQHRDTDVTGLGEVSWG